MSKRGAVRRAWWGAGRGAGVAGADLVHEIPPALISPFPLHQVPRVSLPPPRADLVHEISPALVLPFPLHQVPRVFSPVAGAVLVHEIPPALISPFPLHQVPRVFSPVAGGRGASPPANPCFFVLRHHVLEHSSRSRRRGRGASPLASPCFFVLGHHALEHRRKVMHERLPPAFVHHFSSIIFSKGKN